MNIYSFIFKNISSRNWIIIPTLNPESNPAKPLGAQIEPEKMALKFAPFISDIEIPFYTALTTYKIDVDKLDDSARPLIGLYQPRATLEPGESCRMHILGNALSSKEYDFESLISFLTLTLIVFLQAMFEQRARSGILTPSRTTRTRTRTLYLILQQNKYISRIQYHKTTLTFLDFWCHQRRYNLFDPLPAYIFYNHLLRQPEEIYIHASVLFSRHMVWSCLEAGWGCETESADWSGVHCSCWRGWHVAIWYRQ